MRARILAAIAVVCGAFAAAQSPSHPRLLFSAGDLTSVTRRAKTPVLAPVAQRLLQRADRLLTAAPIVPSITRRGEPDPPGEQKGIASARALQGRVLTHAMAFTLTRDRKYRDAAVGELRRAINDWRISTPRTLHPTI